MADLMLIFSHFGGVEQTRLYLKKVAFNKLYQPPDDPTLLARDLVWRLKEERDDLQKKLIALSKENSSLKRSK